MNEFGKRVKGFIKQHRNYGILLLICATVMHGVLYLYKVNLEAMLYADVICLLIVTVAVMAEFILFSRKCKVFHEVVKQDDMTLKDLPVPVTVIEREYHELLMKIDCKYAADMQEWNQERRTSIDFYSTWIHQIKAPIAAMKLILQGEDTDENRELLAELFRIEQYVNMVLTYYRLEGTETDFVFREAELDELIRQVIHKYAGQFIRKKIRLDYQATNQKILTDEKWFVFLLEQIISNAIKYTNAGVIRIYSENAGELTIADSGIGIAAEDLPRIFEKGFTGYNGRMDKKATGLGLYLCKKTADKLGIQIRCTSVAGEGTSFSIHAAKDPLETD